MSLNLHHLRLFAAVVEHKGFTRAAAALRLSQPAISKSLSELERQIGLPLLERSGRATHLTEAGRALYTRAREIFGLEQAAEQELRELRGLERGLLRVGASTTIATYLLPEMLGRFHSQHPRVAIRTSSANTRAIARMLLEWRIDVALIEGPVSHPRIEVLSWREDELVVIAAHDHPILSAGQVTIQALAEETFIVREPGSGTREVTQRALAERGVTLNRTMRIGGTEAIKHAVAARLGLAIVSKTAAADQLALGRIAVVPVTGLRIRREFTQIRLRGRTPIGAARAFEALLQSSADPGVADASGDPG